jgi:hypothetical protein
MFFNEMYLYYFLIISSIAFFLIFQFVLPYLLAQSVLHRLQADYLFQRIGGDPYYSSRKGIPALIHSHCHVDITPAIAERWLRHFDDALDDCEDDINSHEKGLLLDHMRYSAYFLVAAQKQQQAAAEQGINFLS